MEELDGVQEYKEEVPIDDRDVANEFKYEVAEHFGGEGLLRCLKCGACSGGCPVGAVTDYRPRRVLGKVLLGLKDYILSGDAIWSCAACFTCEERCVQEVNFTDVITILRNMAFKQGHASPGYVKMARSVMENGRVTKSTGSVERLRKKLGLPALMPPSLEDVKEVMSASGFETIMSVFEKEGTSE